MTDLDSIDLSKLRVSFALGGSVQGSLVGFKLQRLLVVTEWTEMS